MELKYLLVQLVLRAVALLIELYGIEIRPWTCPLRSPWTFNRTIWNWNCSARWCLPRCPPPFNRTIWNWNITLVILTLSTPALLIELYGIEICKLQACNVRSSLLIELYGIEINNPRVAGRAAVTFNRTIWNWNLRCRKRSVFASCFVTSTYGLKGRKVMSRILEDS